MEGARGGAPIYSETLRQCRCARRGYTAFVVSAAQKSGRIEELREGEEAEPDLTRIGSVSRTITGR